MILSGWMGRLALPENFQTVFFRQTSHHQFLWHSGQSVRQHSPASHNGCGKLFYACYGENSTMHACQLPWHHGGYQVSTNGIGIRTAA